VVDHHRASVLRHQRVQPVRIADELLAVVEADLQASESGPGATGGSNLIPAACACPRHIRVAPGTLAQGAIICAVCAGEFAAVAFAVPYRKAEPEWQDALAAEDRRGLTALFWAHVGPYGDITLNMTKRLALSQAPPTESHDETV
jgi:hypothetical protein